MQQHDVYRDWLTLYVYQELGPEEEEDLQQHLETCDRCRKDLNELRALMEALDDADTVPDGLLEEARSDLRRGLGLHAPSAGPGWGRLSWWSLPAAVAASLVAGLGLGYAAFATAPTGPARVAELLEGPDVGMVSVEFLDPDASDGQVQMRVRASRDLRVEGSVQSPEVLGVLRQTLMNSTNMGRRLQAVSMLQSGGSQPSTAIQNVLIEALKNDSSAAVRRRALGVLQGLPPTAAMQEALLSVLLNDPNPGMRVAAISMIESTAGFAPLFDTADVERLEASLKQEQNNFIRHHSRAFLREVRGNEVQ